MVSVFRSVVVGAGLLCACAASAGEPYKGIFSRGAIEIPMDIYIEDKPGTFVSPDGTWRIIFEKTAGHNVKVQGRLGKLTFSTMDVVNTEMVWAPDSSGAFITYSDGGNVGGYHLSVVARRHGRLQHLDLTPLIVRAYGHPVRCYYPEPPNVGGIKWLKGNRILVAAEIMPHSICDSMGNFKAYEVDLETMHVIRGYDQLTAKRLFAASLGEELANADDDCVRRPVDCQIPQLHGREN